MTQFDPMPPPTAQRGRGGIIAVAAIIFLLILVAVLITLLASGSGSKSPDRAETSSAPSAPTRLDPSPATKSDDLFIEMMRDQVDWTAAMSDDDLIGMGETVCDAVEEEDGDIGMVIARISIGLDDPDDAGVSELVGFSIGAFCPEYGDNF